MSRKGVKLAGAYIASDKHERLVKFAKDKGIPLAALCREIFDQAIADAASVTRKETITWITDGTLPDSDITVLLCAVDPEAEVDTAFHDGSAWRWCFDGGRVQGPIKAWADLPEGPKP